MIEHIQQIYLLNQFSREPYLCVCVCGLLLCLFLVLV